MPDPVMIPLPCHRRLWSGCQWLFFSVTVDVVSVFLVPSKGPSCGWKECGGERRTGGRLSRILPKLVELIEHVREDKTTSQLLTRKEAEAAPWPGKD